MRTLRFLIADGFVDFLDMMEQVVRRHGHEVLAAPTETGAIEGSTLFGPEVVLFDPAIMSDVPRFVAELRSRIPAGARIIALVLDGELDEKLVDATLRKPFKVADLFALLERWFD